MERNRLEVQATGKVDRGNDVPLEQAIKPHASDMATRVILTARLAQSHSHPVQHLASPQE